MNYTKRALVVLASLAVLAASSQAQIVITPNPADGVTVDSNVPTQADVQTVNTNFQSGIGTYTDSGYFNLTSGLGLKSVTVEANGYVLSDAAVSLNIYIQQGASTLTLFNQTTNNPAFGFGSPVTTTATSPFSLTGAYTVHFTATYVGTANDSLASVDPFTVAFLEKGQNPPPPVPEPASYAVLGIGVVGLISRRRTK